MIDPGRAALEIVLAAPELAFGLLGFVAGFLWDFYRRR